LEGLCGRSATTIGSRRSKDA